MSPCINTGVIDLEDPDGSRSDIGAGYFDHLTPISVDVNTNENWNLIGLPLGVENSAGNDLFPNMVENTLYTFGEDGSYLSVDSLNVGNGYWMRVVTEETSTLTGNPVTQTTWNIRYGWNLISGLSMDVGINSIIDPDSILFFNTLYSYSEGGYSQSDSLKAGNGYWIRSSDDGVIEIRLNP